MTDKFCALEVVIKVLILVLVLVLLAIRSVLSQL